MVRVTDQRNTKSFIVSALVHFEVIKKARILFGEDFTDRIEALPRDGIYIKVTRAIVTRAIDVSIANKLAMADSLIYATALEYEATLWTQALRILRKPPRRGVVL